MIIPNHALNKQTFHCLESVYGNLANWIRKSGYCMVAFSHLYWHIHSHLCLHQCVARPAFRAKILQGSTKSINHDDIVQGHGLVAIHCTEWLQRRASLLYLSHLVTSCLLSSSQKNISKDKVFFSKSLWHWHLLHWKWASLQKFQSCKLCQLSIQGSKSITLNIIHRSGH